MRRLRVRPRVLGALALFLVLGAIVGCGGTETVEIKFPEGTPPPAATATTKPVEGPATSQGDPSQYTK